MLKKTSILICCALMFLTMGIDAFAASIPLVCADEVTLSAGKDVKVPVRISNNSGLMGFHFVLKYDAEAIIVTNVTNSDLTSDGIFSNNLNKKEGVFDVVWSNAESVSKDGTLFILYIRASGLEESTSIGITVVQDDTFDESFENVAVSCRDISIVRGEETEGGSGDTSQGDGKGKPEESFIANEIKDEVISQLDENKVTSIIDSIMKEAGVEDVSKLTPGQARKILSDIRSEMEAQGMSTKELDELIKSAEENEDLDADTILHMAVTDLYQTSEEMASKEDKSFNVDYIVRLKRIAKIAIVTMIIIAACAEVIVLYLRKKKTGAEK